MAATAASGQGGRARADGARWRQEVAATAAGDAQTARGEASRIAGEGRPRRRPMEDPASGSRAAAHAWTRGAHGDEDGRRGRRPRREADRGAACDGERPQRRRIHAGTSSNGERKTSCDGQLPLSRRAAREDDGADPTAVKILDRRRRATMAADPDEQGLLPPPASGSNGGRQMAPRPAEMRRGRPDPGRADRGRGRRRIHDGQGLLLPCP